MTFNSDASPDPRTWTAQPGRVLIVDFRAGKVLGARPAHAEAHERPAPTPAAGGLDQRAA